MRRSESEITDPVLLDGVLSHGVWGTLTVASNEEWPYSVPMNYVYHAGVLYVHSAMAGKRYTLLQSCDRVQFTVVREYSYIPSYALGSDLACPASQAFQSVMLWGHARLVESLEEKSGILTTLMKHHQPEGHYTPITPDDERYHARLRKTAVYAIPPERKTGKFSFAQGMNPAKSLDLVQFLELRNKPLDHLTAQWIRRLQAR